MKNTNMNSLYLSENKYVCKWIRYDRAVSVIKIPKTEDPQTHPDYDYEYQPKLPEPQSIKYNNNNSFWD